MIGRGREMLDSDDSLEHLLGLGVASGRGNNSRAIDEVDAAHQGDVLPDFGLSGDGSSLANGLLLQRVDDGGLANVGVSNETDRNLLLVGEESGELTEKLDEGSLSEGVIDGGMEGDGGVGLGENLDPASLFKNRMSYMDIGSK